LLRPESKLPLTGWSSSFDGKLERAPERAHPPSLHVSGWSPVEFEDRLRQIGLERYHYRHPFNLRMHDGTLSEQEIQTWVRNRYYYQTRIPIKDALIIAKARNPQFRREWVQRIHDHDGVEPGDGGLELWLTLADAVGLSRDSVANLDRVLPGVRAACDAYVDFVSGHNLLESVAASLTEMFAGDIMKVRIAAFEQHYPWVTVDGLRYFQSRTTQAPRDAAWGLSYVIEHACEQEDQQRCAKALARKCEILWNLLDAIEAAHRRPRLSAHAQLRNDTAGGEATVVLPERAVELNATGAQILALCDGDRTTLEVADQLSAQHPNNEQAWDDTHHFLEKMIGLGVVETGEDQRKTDTALRHDAPR
jgi:pyrroloquinoline-quinone synthase